jgi:hypothetical protein
MRDEKNLTKPILLEAQWHYELSKVFFAVLKKNVEFNADDIIKELKVSKVELPPVYVSKSLGAFFRSFKASGHIVKTGKYRLSERNRSTPLPLYVAANSTVVLTDNKTVTKL